jgi:serine protease
MFSRKIVSFAAGLATLASAALVGIPSSASASQGFAGVPAQGAAIGLIAHYSPNTDVQQAHDAIGQKLSALGLDSVSDRPLGAGWHAFSFGTTASESQVSSAVSAIDSLPFVLDATPDRFYRNPAASVGTSGAPMASPLKPGPSGGSSSSSSSSNSSQIDSKTTSDVAAAFKQANSVRNLSAKDAFSTAAPDLPQVQAAWAPPTSLYGAKLVGYRVQTSFDDGATFTNVTPDLGASQLKYSIAAGLTAGTPVSVRVAAITKLKSTTKVGRFSSWSKATPTTVPLTPTFTSAALVSNVMVPTWAQYTPADAGGLPVTFTLVASAPGRPDVTCVTTTYSCNFAGLVAGVSYTVKISAKNARGSSKFVSGFTVNDPYFGKQWALNGANGINVQSAWQRTHGSSSVTVAVLDSGISAHPDLDGQLWRNTDGTPYGYNFVTKTTDPSGLGCSANPVDPNSANEWHGTHVSGIIAAANNDIGVVGVAPGVKLLEVRVMGPNGGSESDLIAALNWASGRDVPASAACGVVPKNLHPAQVINLSLGNQSFGCDTATSSALQAIKALNITVVSAAGNDGSTAAYSYPGNCFPTINVGASTYEGGLATYSNFGVGLDIAAPGGDMAFTATNVPDGLDSSILSTINEGGFNAAQNKPPVGPGEPGYEAMAGTSMAAPFVSGVVALLYSVKPDITVDQVWDALHLPGNVTPWPSVVSNLSNGTFKQDCSTVQPYTRTGCGFGIVNAGLAVQYVAKLK